MKLLYANTHDADAFYAIRIHVPDAFFYLDTGKKKYVFLDHREYGVFAEKNKNSDIELVLLNPLIEAVHAKRGDAEGSSKIGLHILEKYGVIGEEIAVPTSFPLDMADYLRAKGVRLVPTAPIFPERVIKTAWEIEAIRDSLKRTHRAFAFVEEVLHASAIKGDTIVYKGEIVTSEWMRTKIEHIFVDERVINVEGIILSCGAHAAIPHHQGSGPWRPHQTIICDIFPRHAETGYFADMTRTYVKGEPSEAIQGLYAAVLEAQTKGIEAVKPGALLSTPHQISIDTFLAKGYHVGDKGFIHGTGHGLGLQVHEPPYVGTGHDKPFEVGHVITIEPGLYYPEIGGVRIEDVIAVTKDGNENLTNYHKNYVIP